MLRPEIDFAGSRAGSDEALMEAITRSSTGSFERISSRATASRIKSVIGSVVHEEGEADDVLQEILIQVWREAGRYSPKAGKLLGWIVTLARRRAIDRLRRKQAYCRAKERYESILGSAAGDGCDTPLHSTTFRAQTCGIIFVAD